MGISAPISRVTEYYSRHGFKATLQRARVALTRALFAPRMVVFSLDLDRQSLRPVVVPSPFRIDRLKSEAEFTEQVLQAMIGLWNPRLARQNMHNRFANGAELWVIKSEEQLAAFCWTKRGAAISPYYFPIASDDVQLFDVYALPKFRGGAVLWFLIGSMLHVQKAEGAARVYADMAEWNRGSLAFYGRMTPFRRLGVARSVAILGRKFVSWSEITGRAPQITEKREQEKQEKVSAMVASHER